ncbi:hypothetical protein F5X98DRAFT_373480 [Xylaria grammica]|nr:hypothetical protein F5X98DRAFT_373480 [Xylaria grammica]
MARTTNKEMLGANLAADAAVCRGEHHNIDNELFNQLISGSISRWIETRPNKEELYQDLFDHAFAKIHACRQNQRQRQAGPSTHSTHSTSITLKNEDSILDGKFSCKYLEPYNSFEPQTPGLGTWVPMFMTKEEIYSTAPAMGRLDKSKSDSLLAFIRYLNPNYISFRADHVINIVGTDGFTLPDMRSAKDTVRAWNNAREFGLRSSLIRALAAVSCFSHFRQFERAVVRSQLLENPDGMRTYFEDSACAMFAELDNETCRHTRVTVEKWRKIKNLGANLSVLARHFGGEGFLILFPLSELEVFLGKQLLGVHSTIALWKVLYDVLHSTEMGVFFKSMARTIGIPLIDNCCGGPSLPQREYFQRLDAIRLQYSLPPISESTPRLAASVLARKPGSAPFGYCDSLEAKHLTPNLPLTPLSLLQVAGNLEPGIVEYLIRKNLPREWAVIGREEISRPATKGLLLCDYQGIMIPLLINNGWTLFCYTNPIRSDTDHLIKLINPTKSYDRHRVALNMLSAWIPSHAPWAPNGLKVQLVKVVESQRTVEDDSGIHVILNAIAMAGTGKPELRLLNEQICKGLRIKYFVHLLNDLQEVVNKEAMENIG